MDQKARPVLEDLLNTVYLYGWQGHHTQCKILACAPAATKGSGGLSALMRSIHSVPLKLLGTPPQLRVSPGDTITDLHCLCDKAQPELFESRLGSSRMWILHPNSRPSGVTVWPTPTSCSPSSLPVVHTQQPPKLLGSEQLVESRMMHAGTQAVPRPVRGPARFQRS